MVAGRHPKSEADNLALADGAHPKSEADHCHPATSSP